MSRIVTAYTIATPEFVAPAASDPNDPVFIRRTSDGVVLLQGRVINLPNPVAIFLTLPLGFRPTIPQYLDWSGGIPERGFYVIPTGTIRALDSVTALRFDTAFKAAP